MLLARTCRECHVTAGEPDLEMAKLGPAGREYPLRAYVFGVLGERINGIRKAWETALLKALAAAPRFCQVLGFRKARAFSACT
jgi:hypothetical protein